jgi:hypothetical protein
MSVYTTKNALAGVHSARLLTFSARDLDVEDVEM